MSSRAGTTPPPAAPLVRRSWWAAVLCLAVAAGLAAARSWWLAVVALALAVFLALGRHMINNQVEGDVEELELARGRAEAGEGPEFVQFVEKRCAQLLKDVKILTPEGRRLLEEYRRWATGQASRATGDRSS